MCFAVIICSVISANDRYGNIDRSNSLVTIGHVEGYYLEVGIGVRKPIRSQTHVGSTSICPFSFCLSAEGEVLFYIIQFIISRSCVAGHFVCSTVVCRSIVSTNDSYGYINRVNRLVTVSHREVYSTEVSIRVRELFFSETHVGGANICTRSRCGASKREVLGYIIQRIVCCCCISSHSMCFSIVN